MEITLPEHKINRALNLFFLYIGYQTVIIDVILAINQSDSRNSLILPFGCQLLLGVHHWRTCKFKVKRNKTKCFKSFRISEMHL